MKWPLLILLLAVSLGLISLNEVISFRFIFINVYGNDLVFYTSGIYAAIQYLKYRGFKQFYTQNRFLILNTIVLYSFVVLFSILQEYQNGASGWSSLQLLIRVWPFYLLFFALPAFIISKDDLQKVFKLFLLICCVGNVIIIAQSLHGPGNLFGIGFLDLIYGKPGPQIIYKYGIFYRSLFPISFSCIWCFFYFLTKLHFKFKVEYVIGVIFFSFSFLLNMSRGLFAGIAVALALDMFLLNYRKRMSIFIIFAAIIAIIIIIPMATNNLSGDDLLSNIFLRIQQGLNDFQTQNGSWGFRLNQFNLLVNSRPDYYSWLFGWGYTGSLSTTGIVNFIEFGVIDPVFRSGIIGTIILIWVVANSLKSTIATYLKQTDLFYISIGLAFFSSLISELVNLLAADHFLYIYFGSLISLSLALLAIIHYYSAEPEKNYG